MKLNVFLFVLSSLVLSACNWMGKTVEGNGKITSESRKVAKADKLIFKGNFEVKIQSGTSASVAVETDENLQHLVIMSESDAGLVFKTKQKWNIKSDHGIKIIITTPILQSIHIGGSATVIGTGKFTGANQLKIDIAGNGEVILDVNTPKVIGEIAGVGSIVLSGETAAAEFKIAGSGECDALQLKAESAKVKVTGNGSVKIFAASFLDVNIVGNGNVEYKGEPNLKQKIVGIGSIKQMN